MGYVNKRRLIVKFLMRNPGDFNDVLLLHGPPASHIQEIAQAVQVALHSRVHLVLFHERHDGTLRTTADGAAHLESGATRGRGLRSTQCGANTGIVKVLKGGSFASISSIHFSRMATLSSGNLVFSTFFDLCVIKEGCPHSL